MARSGRRDLEAEPFLVDEKQAASGTYLYHPSHHGSPSKPSYISCWAILVHLAFICSYTAAYLVAVYGRERGFALLNDTIQGLNLQVRPTEYVVAGASPYAGGPTAEVDGAWHQLLANISIRVSDEEIARNGDQTSSIRLPAGGGQMVWLGVFHQLHCLKKLRQLNYPQAYAAQQTEDGRLDQEVHINHCIELLRQSVMCNPDTTLTTFSWSRTKPKPVLNIGGFERQCVDWEAFMAGILPRVVGSDEADALVNPNLVDSE